MPFEPDIEAFRAEAKSLMQTAQVPPLRITLLLLAVNLALSLLDAALTPLIGGKISGPLPVSISFVSVLTSLLSTVLFAGYMSYCLGVHRGGERPYADLLDALPFAGRVILLDVLTGLAIGAGLMLFVVPGVILAFAYSMALLHLCEDPDMGVIAAMRRSRLEMRGRKWQLARLYLSFWPLFLLAAAVSSVCEVLLSGLLPETYAGDLLFVLTYGVLSGAVRLYLTPYLMLSKTGFYRFLTEEAPPLPDETP